MSVKAIFTGPSYRNFIQTIHSPDTKGAYRNSLSLYLRFKKVHSCEQLIEDPTIIQAQLIDYIIYMREELQLSQYRNTTGYESPIVISLLILVYIIVCNYTSKPKSTVYFFHLLIYLKAVHIRHFSI